MELTYPVQRPQSPSLSPHFVLNTYIKSKPLIIYNYLTPGLTAGKLLVCGQKLKI